MKSSKIPPGWEYWTTEPTSGTQGEDKAWELALRLKAKREELKPNLFVRVRVVKAAGGHWILRREEPRVKETAA